MIFFLFIFACVFTFGLTFALALDAIFTFAFALEIPRDFMDDLGPRGVLANA